MMYPMKNLAVDNTWVRYFDAESKLQIIIWRPKGSPRPLKNLESFCQPTLVLGIFGTFGSVILSLIHHVVTHLYLMQNGYQKFAK